MIRISSKEYLNAPAYLIEYSLAIIKITNENPNSLQKQADYSTISKTIESVRIKIYECAQEYEIIKDLNSETFENLINCYDFPICDRKLIHLCDLLLLFKSAGNIKFVSETSQRQTLQTDEMEFIGGIIQNELFEHLKISRKIEEYALLITWDRLTPPTSFIYKKHKNEYTYAASNPRPIFVSKSSLKQMRDKEAENFKPKSSITDHLYQRLIQKGFISPSPSRTKLETKPACFIYDTLMFLGYFSNNYSIYNKKCQINKAKRDCIKELIEFKK